MMKALWVFLAIYLAGGIFTVWFVAQMPWFLTPRDYLLVGLQWPLFWIAELRR